MGVKLENKKLSGCCWLAVALLAGWSGGGVAPAVSRVEEGDVRHDATVLATEKVLPCVVNIATSELVEYRDFYQQLLQDFYGQRTPTRSREEFNVGSGVIIDEEGYVLTNLHVVRRASRVQVKLADGRIYDAEPRFIGTTLKDVALLKLKTKPGEKFKAIQFAKDDDLLLGETVLALGNPFGLGASVTRGILSSKNRRPLVGGEPLNVEDWLQTDAAINPGNSGGPLINLRGEMIGLSVAVFPKGQGLGFAIPVRQLAEALSEFFVPEVTDGLWLGLKVKAGPYPLHITAIQPGSPAEKAGLRVGQEIVGVNGERPDGLVDFHRRVTSSPARRVTFAVVDQGKQRSFSTPLLTLEDLVRTRAGLTLVPLTPQAAASFRVQPGQGLLIEAIEKNSPAERAQLPSGVLLTAIDGQAVGDLLNAAILLSAKKPGETAQLAVVVPRRLGNNYTELRPGTVAVTTR